MEKFINFAEIGGNLCFSNRREYAICIIDLGEMDAPAVEVQTVAELLILYKLYLSEFRYGQRVYSLPLTKICCTCIHPAPFIPISSIGINIAPFKELVL